MAIGNSQFSRRNSLLRRVQRHRSLSVIFRAVETVPQQTWDRRDWAGVPPVRATLASPDVWRADTVTPVAKSVIPASLASSLILPPSPLSLGPTAVPPEQRPAQAPPAPADVPEPASQRKSDRLLAILRKHEEKRASADREQVATSLVDRIEAPWLKHLARNQEQAISGKSMIKPHERPKPQMPESTLQRRRSQVQYMPGYETEPAFVSPTEGDDDKPTIMSDITLSEPPASQSVEPAQRQGIEKASQFNVAGGERELETAVFPSVDEPEPKPLIAPLATPASVVPDTMVQRQTHDDASLTGEDDTSSGAVESDAPLAEEQQGEVLQRMETAVSTLSKSTPQPPATTPVTAQYAEAEPISPVLDKVESDVLPEVEEHVGEAELDAELPKRPTANVPQSAALSPPDSVPPQIETVGTKSGKIIDRTVEYYQPIPLQEALPVQRKAAPPSKEPQLIQPMSIIPSTQELIRRETPDDDRIREHLQQVRAEQITDSSVELVMPRHPRPTLMPQTQSRQPDITTEVTEREHETSAEQAEATLVETEIGALPGDLWHLLGQAPPADRPATSPSGQREIPRLDTPMHQRSLEMGLPDARMDTTAVLQRAAALAPKRQQASIGSPQADAFGDVIPDIQRAVEGTAVVSSAPAPSENGAGNAVTDNAATGEASENEEAEIDIDALAQEVYQKLKRRLQFDRERNGRF